MGREGRIKIYRNRFCGGWIDKLWKKRFMEIRKKNGRMGRINLSGVEIICNGEVRIYIYIIKGNGKRIGRGNIYFKDFIKEIGVWVNDFYKKEIYNWGRINGDKNSNYNIRIKIWYIVERKRS